MNRIFVYGILKNRYADAQKARVYKHRLADMGWFPAAIPHENGVIIGELIDVDDEVVENFDKIEGHPNFYIRTNVTVEVLGEDGAPISIDAQMYVITAPHHSRTSEPTSSLTITDDQNPKTGEWSQTYEYNC